MEFKRYRKGKHTYTRIGHGVEVRDERVRPVEAEYGAGVREVYANRFVVVGCRDAVEVRFKLGLLAVGEREVACVRLPWKAALALKADLERLLAGEGR